MPHWWWWRIQWVFSCKVQRLDIQRKTACHSKIAVMFGLKYNILLFFFSWTKSQRTKAKNSSENRYIFARKSLKVEYKVYLHNLQLPNGIFPAAGADDDEPSCVYKYTHVINTCVLCFVIFPHVCFVMNIVIVTFTAIFVFSFFVFTQNIASVVVCWRRRREHLIFVDDGMNHEFWWNVASFPEYQME